MSSFRYSGLNNTDSRETSRAPRLIVITGSSKTLDACAGTGPRGWCILLRLSLDDDNYDCNDDSSQQS